MTAPEVDGWSGAWVAKRLPARLETTSSPVGVDAAGLLGLALRRNPRRAHLLVSRVLGKHVPADPRLVYGAGLLLGELVRRDLAGEPDEPGGFEAAAALLRAAVAPGAAPDAAAALPETVRAAGAGTPPAGDPVVVLGYAETATGLGHCVADALGADCLHSTRRPVPGVPAAETFREEHSHATGHLLLPADPALLAGVGPVVLVDDELSTGRTVLNTVAALHRLRARERYVVATLVDLRSAKDRDRMAAAAATLGTRIDVVALCAGQIALPADALDRGRALVGGLEAPPRWDSRGLRGGLRDLEVGWPSGVPVTGRHGLTAADARALADAAREAAGRLAATLWPGSHPPGGHVLVLGTEELMYAPVRIATALADLVDAVPGSSAQVSFSTTTRSPVLAVDDPGYAVRTRLVFPAHDNPADGPGDRYAYNVAGPGGSRRFDAVVLVVDAAGDTPALCAPGGLLDRLRAVTGEVVTCVLPDAGPALAPRQRTTRRLPSPLVGPAFGSYAADEVAWLLKDLSGVPLEAPVEEREEAVQLRGAHYAESLPLEYQPSPEYQELFHRALAGSAGRIARAVGVVTEAVLAARGPGVVLVSLARAGTPVGILMRRWAQSRHGLAPAHYAVSIVRGRGLDPVALRWLAANHDPAAVVFVDGWTGKGAIARELAATLAAHTAAGGPTFDPDLAVLADPGCAVPIAGTRDDFLVPSACLNSTVSGLVSRTVLRRDLIGPADFHGAKFYRDLAATDVSAEFLDAVGAQFGAVAAAVDAAVATGSAAARPVTWAGWAAVERISAEYGIGDVNLVKPGVGETTRVLLRRVPWKILAHPGAGADLDHVRLLAATRGVPVEPVEGLPYSCVGLVHPRYTRGAVGSAGVAAALSEAT